MSSQISFSLSFNCHHRHLHLNSQTAMPSFKCQQTIVIFKQCAFITAFPSWIFYLFSILIIVTNLDLKHIENFKTFFNFDKLHFFSFFFLQKAFLLPLFNLTFRLCQIKTTYLSLTSIHPISAQGYFILPDSLKKLLHILFFISSIS